MLGIQSIQSPPVRRDSWGRRLSNFTNATGISYHDSVRLFEAAGHEHFGESSDYAQRRPNLMSETRSKSYTGGESVRLELTAL
jgi:hypothetical protein